MTYANAREALAGLMRFVPDFPEEGVLFQDLTPALADAEGFRLIIDDLAAACERMGAEVIGGLDARGFLLGSAVAYKLGLGILAVRKKGKLPPPVYSEGYDLEYGSAALEVPATSLDLKGQRVVLVDDLLATGGTMGAAVKLLRHCGAEIGGLCVVLEIPELDGRKALEGTEIHVVNQVEE